MATKSPLHPSVSLLVKLGSVVVHAEEMIEHDATALPFMGSPAAPFDTAALRTLFDDPEVRQWLQQMDALAFLPKKRN